jgi:hypothetical protein
MRLAEEAGEDGERQEEEQPRVVHHERRAERSERDQVLAHRQQHGDEPDARRRLPARSLEMIVEVGVLELLEIEGGGVAHQAHADVVREQVAEQRLDERRCPGEQLTDDDDRELERDDSPQVAERSARLSREQHDLVDDQLGCPQRGDGHEGAHESERHHRHGQSAMRLPHEPHELRQISQHFEARTHSARPFHLGERRTRVGHRDGHGHSST